MFVTDDEFQRKNIRIYSDYFPQAFDLDDENLSKKFFRQFETIGHQWNFVHHKEKRMKLKQRLGFLLPQSVIVDYETCRQRFESENDEEIDQMTFDDCLDYLKLTGDILTWPCQNNQTIINRPYHLLNEIFARTIFRSDLEQWLNYEQNVIFHYSGFYLTSSEFEIDRQRIFQRGEFSWKMLNVLFHDQHNKSCDLTEKYIIENCRLMEKLFLGFVNESNLNCKSSFVFFLLLNSSWFFRSRIHNVIVRLSVVSQRILESHRSIEIFYVIRKTTTLRSNEI